MGKGRIFLYLCLSFVGGIFIRSFFPIPREALWGIIVLGLACVMPIWREKRFIIFGFCILFAALGIYRYQQKAGEVSKIAYHNDRGEVVLKGIISRDPDVRSKIIQFTFETDSIIIDGARSPASGNVLVTSKRYPEYHYGDELEIKGELETPKNFSDFDYRAYLAKEGIYSVVSFPEITLLSHDEGNTIFAWIFEVKHALRDSITKNLSSPESEILSGILLGEQRKVSDDLLEKFNITGTRHIMAISGMNITIISEIVLSVLLFLGLWRTQAFISSLFFITIFILMIGAPASAVRAGVMAGVLLFAQNLGRPRNENRAVLYAALAMVFINPLLFRFDAGFQLSFLAILGIIYFSKYFEERLRFLPKVIGIRGVSAMTVAAQIMTLPLLLSTFGRVSLVSLPANILIVPLLPLVMVGGFIAALGGMFSEIIGKVLFLPLWLILHYIILVIEFFSRVPLASFSFEKVSWGLVPFYYVLLFWFWRRFIRKKLVQRSVLDQQEAPGK